MTWFLDGMLGRAEAGPAVYAVGDRRGRWRWRTSCGFWGRRRPGSCHPPPCSSPSARPAARPSFSPARGTDSDGCDRQQRRGRRTQPGQEARIEPVR